MFYLLLAIICSGSIALVFKVSEMKNCNRYLVTTINYLTAFIISSVVFFSSELTLPSSLDGLWSATAGNFGGNLTPLGSIGASIVLGIITGLLFFVSFIIYQKSISECGASLSGMFSKMGILIPMIFSIFIWNEIPSAIKWLGIILSFASIVIVNVNPANIKESAFRPILLILCVLYGTADFMNKVFQKYALVEYKNLFLLIVFLSATIFSLSLLVKNRDKGINLFGCFIGLCAGIPNMFASFFLIDSLKSLEAAVVYPMYSAGGVVFIMAMSYILFKERLTKKELFAAGLTIVSMVIINL
ncbi:DMT family transporter [Peptacetobacter hominis]|uniref:DMT family transporter n=1 Tax=Peptacetobacter hominis TaxID=2743610 RepID=A0A544QTP6_9FIRM|nr:DMT family transporter [Peptacetobacter hominis]TQQ84066.1 DMT family transporter [Peptacetobacter hominis]